MNKDAFRERARLIRATTYLSIQGWKPMGSWKFQSPSGTLHDMSAADLEQLGRIESESLFAI